MTLGPSSSLCPKENYFSPSLSPHLPPTQLDLLLQQSLIMEFVPHAVRYFSQKFSQDRQYSPSPLPTSSPLWCPSILPTRLFFAISSPFFSTALINLSYCHLLLAPLHSSLHTLARKTVLNANYTMSFPTFEILCWFTVLWVKSIILQEFSTSRLHLVLSHLSSLVSLHSYPSFSLQLPKTLFPPILKHTFESGLACQTSTVGQAPWEFQSCLSHSPCPPGVSSHGKTGAQLYPLI